MKNVSTDIDEMALYFPCPLCGAQAQKACHVRSRPKVRYYPHKMRTQRLWDLYSAGFQAGMKAKRKKEMVS